MTKSPIDLTIGKRVQEARQQRDTTRQNLADGLGITPHQIQKYESGANRVSASTLYRMAQLLGVDVSFFFEDASGSSDKPLHDLEMAAAFARIEDPGVRECMVRLTEVLAAHRETSS